MIASALQLVGLTILCVACWLIDPILGLAVAGLSSFAVGFILEAR